jgi:predicted PurR-regulated permease PerM
MPEAKSSPTWGNTTKLIISFLLIFIVAVLIWQFKQFIGPVLFAFLLSYLLHPVGNFLKNRVRLSWRAGVTILYLLIFLILIGLLTWGGFSLVQPLQSLLNFLQKILQDVPGFLADLTSKPLVIGTISLDLSKLHSSTLWTELQSTLSPAFNKLGSLLGDIAAGAANIVTMTAFTILISYFITVESTGVRSDLINFRIPRYQDDIGRFSKHISRIWNSYFRGQLTIFTITVVFYTILLSVLGVHYAFGLALLAGFARFVPYVGPFVAWTTYGLVAIFQGTTIFGLLPFPYALVVVGCALITDVIMDNFVSPRIMSDALGVHPALVLISVLVAAKLLGVVGVIIAAPVIATLKLLFTYIFRKLFDQDPWEDVKIAAAPVPFGKIFSSWFMKIKLFFMKIGKFFERLVVSQRDKNRNKPKE